MRKLWWLLLLCGSAIAQDIAVDQLPLGGTIGASDYTICDQSGNTNKCFMSQLAQYVAGGLSNVPLSALATIPGYTALCNNANSQNYPSACTNITIVNNSPTLGQTYRDGTMVIVSTLGNVTGPSYHIGNNFLLIDNGAQFSYGATTLEAQMNFGGTTITGTRAAGVFSTVMSGKTGNTAGSESYAGFDGYCTANANDNGTGLTISTAFGSCFGGNFIATLQSGATNWQGNIGVEVDNEVDAGASVAVNVGIQSVKLANSRGTGAIEDAAFVVGAQAGATGWMLGVALDNEGTVGAFPYQSGGTMIGMYQSGTVAYGLDIHRATCTAYCLYSPGFTVDGSGNEVVNGMTSTSGAVNTTNSALNLEVGAVAVQSLTTTGGAHVNTSPLISIGNQFTAASSCGGTITITPGTFGPESGYFTVPTGGTNCQFTMTIGGAVPVSAPHGWYCSGEDFTSKVLAVQANQSTTTCVLQVTAATSDIILWGVVRGY